jgi:drug/metabolite transporter (DMT)-like permease
MLDIAILYTICASTFTLAKLSLSCAQPIFGIGVRFLVAAIIFIPLSRLLKSWRPIEKNDWSLFLQVALIGIYGAYVCDLWSLQYITSTESSLIFNLSPFASALFSYFWFGERMTSTKWAGLLIGFCSVPLLLCTGGVGCVTPLLFYGSRIFPIFVTCCAVAFGSYNWIVVRELVKNRGYAPLMVNGVTMAIGGFCALITGLLVDTSPLVFPGQGLRFALITLLNVAICSGLFSTMYGLLLKKYTATLLSFAGCLTPIMTALFGWLLLGETLSWAIAGAALLVILGLFIFYREELRQGYVE